MTRAWLKAKAGSLMAGTGIDQMASALWGGWNGPAVLGYHRVVESFTETAKTSIPSLLVSMGMLEKHLDWVGRHFRWVSLDEVGERLENGGTGNIAALTFDDGYRDFYELAFPLLQRKGIPATVFVVTDLINAQKPQIHDKLYFLLAQRLNRRVPQSWNGIPVPDVTSLPPYRAMRALLEALPLAAVEHVIKILEEEVALSPSTFESFQSLTWETLQRLHRAGVTVGSHTKSHVLITNEKPERIAAEVEGSRREIEQRLHAPVRHFSYPSGFFNTSAVKAVAAAGYRYGYTGCTHRDRQSPLLTIPRALLWENSSLDARNDFSGPVLNCQLRHAFDWANQCRQRHALCQEANARA
jgi:peptidoglycan/xylan/chitin deacetylase (PgdA/CDA1 family)